MKRSYRVRFFHTTPFERDGIQLLYEVIMKSENAIDAARNAWYDKLPDSVDLDLTDWVVVEPPLCGEIILFAIEHCIKDNHKQYVLHCDPWYSIPEWRVLK